MKKILLVAVPAILLSFLSLTILASFAPTRLVFQLIFLLLAIAAGWVAQSVGMKNWLLLSTPIYWGTFILLVLTYLFGNAARGSTRWLELGALRLQASEFAKPAILLMAINLFLSDWPKQFWRQWVWLLKRLAVLAPMIGIILWQPDLGTALSLLAIAGAVIFFSGIPKKMLISILTLLLLLIPTADLFLKDYQMRRLETFIDPYKDPRGAGYQVIQSTIAAGSGLIWGRGLGRGTQSQLKFLPERHTDFIFAGLMEELGLVGGFLVVGLYTAMLAGIMAAAFETKKKANWLLLTAAASWLFFQAGINISMNLGLTPVTGIPLPFLSAGGSSLIASAIMLGLTVSAVME